MSEKPDQLNISPKPRDSVKKTDVVIPGYENKLAFVLQGVFSEEECKEFIRFTESRGYEQALVNVGYGQQRLMTDVRNNTRCMVDDETIAGIIFSRLQEYIPRTWMRKKLVGLNERLRFLRYGPGQYFAPHMDGNYLRCAVTEPNRPERWGEKSYLTIHLYLNEECEGGATTFFGKRGVEVPCSPRTGQVLIFEQAGLQHEGSVLKSGTKYTMRTDVMYKEAEDDE